MQLLTPTHPRTHFSIQPGNEFWVLLERAVCVLLAYKFWFHKKIVCVRYAKRKSVFWRSQMSADSSACRTFGHKYPKRCTAG